MSSLTHAERRKKARRSTPRAKRRAALTSKMRAIAREKGWRRHNRPSELAEACEINRLSRVDPDGRSWRKHKARKPGTVRLTRLPGGSGFRNNWEG